jgi:hypothetical protein
MPVVEGDLEAVQVGLAAALDLRDEGFGRLARLFGGQHDRRPMGVVGPHEMHLVALHALESHPDISLDVFHDVADVERAVRVGQRGGDEELSRRHEGRRF